MLLIIFNIFISISATAEGISLSEFLKQVWQNGPVAHGEAAQNEAADQFVKAARGRYFPQVSLEAIDTTGFPASNSGLQIGGLMGSPFRSGLAGGVVVEQTVFDFGRIRAQLEQAKASRSLDQARLAEEKYRYLLAAGQLYLSCARTHSLQKIDAELMDWAEINLRETARFTKTGQRSIIDNALVKTEVNRLKLELVDAQKFAQTLEEQMKIFGAHAGCRELRDSWQVQVPSALQVEDPALLLGRARRELALSAYEGARSAQLPKVKAMGSVGDMEDERLIGKKQYYAAGVGVSFPVWNGGEDGHREQAYKSQADFQSESLKAAELEFTSRLKGMRDQVVRDRETLSVLERDLEQVEKTIKLASQRYHSLQGPLIDVREAFKQLRDMNIQRLHLMAQLGTNALQLGMLRTTGVNND